MAERGRIAEARYAARWGGWLVARAGAVAVASVPAALLARGIDAGFNAFGKPTFLGGMLDALHDARDALTDGNAAEQVASIPLIAGAAVADIGGAALGGLDGVSDLVTTDGPLGEKFDTGIDVVAAGMVAGAGGYATYKVGAEHVAVAPPKF